jgi:hypothetical protein
MRKNATLGDAAPAAVASVAEGDRRNMDAS